MSIPVSVPHPHIVNEDENRSKKRALYVSETFGNNKQPVLHRVDFEVEACLLSNSLVDYKGPFPCHVRFEGVSVLDGIRALVEEGCADPPLPPHLSELNSLSQNYFLIREKKQT